jgi:hypothetical protein
MVIKMIVFVACQIEKKDGVLSESGWSLRSSKGRLSRRTLQKRI